MFVTLVISNVFTTPVRVTLSVSTPAPPLSTSLLKIVFEAPLSASGAENVSLAVVPVKLSEPVVSGRIVTLKKVNHINNLYAY